jgi:hypothetical protein
MTPTAHTNRLEIIVVVLDLVILDKDFAVGTL